MKALIILVVLISYSIQQPSLSLGDTFVCPDDKIKIGEDVCAITSSEHGKKNADESITYIKKKSCGKNKACGWKYDNYNKNTDTTVFTNGEEDDTIYTCQKKLKLLKIKKNIIIMQNFTPVINFDSNCQIKYTDRTEEYSADGKTTNTFDGYEVS